MNEMTEIHADPKMDPSYESEEDEMEEDDKRQGTALHKLQNFHDIFCLCVSALTFWFSNNYRHLHEIERQWWWLLRERRKGDSFSKERRRV